MKNCFKEKRGSFTVLITLIFVTVFLFMSTIIRASANLAIKSSVDSLGNLFSKNILAEYDEILFDRYGLIAVNLNEYELENKVNFYFNSTFNDKRYIRYKFLSSDLDSFSLVNGNNFLSQVKNVLLVGSKPEISDYFYVDESDDINHKVTSQWIINELPSNNITYSLDQNLISNVSINEYLFRYFKDYVNERDLEGTFFNNEIEYVITGILDDEKARKKVFNEMIVLRNVVNLKYLYSCDEKRDAVKAISVLISPEFSLEVELLILEAWAYLESKNDILLLYDGKTVPTVKDDESWAIDLDSAKNYIFNKKDETYENLEEFDYEDENISKAIEPDVIKGKDYDYYLKSLLLTVSEEKKVYRTLDLIQLNMKYLYKDTFLIEDYVTEISYKIRVNSREYEFVSSY